MDISKGFIYIRTNELFKLHNLVKLGKTINILNREDTYVTSEPNRGLYYCYRG